MTTRLEESACKKLRLYKLSLRADAGVEDVSRQNSIGISLLTTESREKLCTPIIHRKPKNTKTTPMIFGK